jgi:predicted DNA-binding transcriptional regulator AlpA
MKARGDALTTLPAKLHPEQRLTADQAMLLTGRGRSKFFADVKAGKLPQPAEREGRFVRWRAGDILATLSRAVA